MVLLKRNDDEYILTKQIYDLIQDRYSDLLSYQYFDGNSPLFVQDI